MKRLCFHRRLIRMRAHKQSKYGLENRAKAITVDKYECLIFVCCKLCGKIMDVSLDGASR